MTAQSTHSFNHESHVFQTNEAVDSGGEKDPLQGESLSETLVAIDEATQLASAELAIDDPNSLGVVNATEGILLREAEDSIVKGDPPQEVLRHVEAAATFGLLRYEGLLPRSGNDNVIAVMDQEGLHDELRKIQDSFAERDVMIGSADAAVEMGKIMARHPDMGSDTDPTTEFIEDISPERTANYQGNWTQAQTERMKSDDFLAKFAEFTARGAEGLPETIVVSSLFTKERVARAEYLQRLEDYPSLHSNVTSKIDYVPAAARMHHPRALGTAKYGAIDSEVALFSDALLDNRQKDIIAAHEMYHGLINPLGDNIEEIRSAFDFGKVDEHNKRVSLGTAEKRISNKYMQRADELTARMAQVKNYFGMKSGEQFTSDHLRYAREHYITDTTLDNDMSLFFDMADDTRFVELMNEIPV